MEKNKNNVNLGLTLPWKSKANLFTKYKLKKKWRFWRQFKKFFLGRKKKKILFHKLNWTFFQKRIVWHQLSSLYSHSIKNLIHSKNQTKVMFGARFFKMISLLELRLNILVLRMQLSTKLAEANSLIAEGNIRLNGLKCHKNTLVCVNDIVSKQLDSNPNKSGIRTERLNWRRWKWRKWRRKNKSLKKHLKQALPTPAFKKIKINLAANYIEMNYKIQAGVVIKKPILGEVLLSNKNRMLRSATLRKIYFLY